MPAVSQSCSRALSRPLACVADAPSSRECGLRSISCDHVSNDVGHASSKLVCLTKLSLVPLFCTTAAASKHLCLQVGNRAWNKELTHLSICTVLPSFARAQCCYCDVACTEYLLFPGTIWTVSIARPLKHRDPTL